MGFQLRKNVFSASMDKLSMSSSKSTSTNKVGSSSAGRDELTMSSTSTLTKTVGSFSAGTEELTMSSSSTTKTGDSCHINYRKTTSVMYFLFGHLFLCMFV